MTSKQRAYLKGLAMTMDPIFQIGKSSLTPELTAAVAEALEARELIKLNILKNCVDDGNELAAVLAERTHAQVVQVIGKKIVLYKRGQRTRRKRKIVLPKIKELHSANESLTERIRMTMKKIGIMGGTFDPNP